MFVRNLAIVFGPTLIRKSDDSLVSMVNDMTDQCRVVESVVVHHAWCFSSWDVDAHVPRDDPPPGEGKKSSLQIMFFNLLLFHVLTYPRTFQLVLFH